jgi:hypothetical protein
MTVMDQWVDQLIAEIATRLGLAVPRDDPIIVLQTACLPHALAQLDKNLVRRVDPDRTQARELQIQDHVKGQRHGRCENQYGEPVSHLGGARDVANKRRANDVKTRLVIDSFDKQFWLFLLPFLQSLNRRLMFHCTLNPDLIRDVRQRTDPWNHPD